MSFTLNKIGFKLLVVCLSFTLPIAVMLRLMVAAKEKDINFAVWEKKGDYFQRSLEELLENASLMRVNFWRKANGLSESDVEEKARKGFALGMSRLKEANQSVGIDLQFTPDGLGKRNRLEYTVDGLEKKWLATLQIDPNSPEKMIAKDEAFVGVINHIKTMITHSGDTSNLILDPDLDSYYLMDVSLLALPQAQERVQNILSFIEKILHKGAVSAEERLQVAVMASFLKEADLDRIVASTKTALNEDQNFYGLSPSLQKTMSPGLIELESAIDPLVVQIRAFSMVEDLKSFDIERFRKTASNALTSLYSFHRQVFDEEDKLLETRIMSFKEDVKVAIFWTTIALIISAALAFVIATNIIRRIKFFNQVTKKIAAGDKQARVNMKSGDEIGELARSFDTMTDKIENLNDEVEQKNEELKSINSNLEKIVAERTATIKTILDNVKFGFLLVDKNLDIQSGYSKSCHDLLGERLRPGVKFLKVVGLNETRNGALFAEFLSQAFQDELPEEMTLQQLPPRVQLGEKIISLVASPVRTETGAVSSILFTLIDATNLERMERENHRHKVLVRLLKEIDSFKDFIDETKTRLALCRKFVQQSEQGKARAELHTIKGNTAAYDMVDIAKIVHNIEDQTRVEVQDIDRVESSFVAFLEQNYDVLSLSWSGEGDEVYQVTRIDLQGLIDRVRNSGGADAKSVQELADWATSVQFKSARSLVGALPDYGERLASRMGKAVKVRLEGGETRVDPEVMRPIMQSLVHIVRNAIDHGIEMPHQREGKPEEATVNIVCSQTPSAWQIVVSDDGRGIDLDRVAMKAVESGLMSKDRVQTMSTREKLRLIFVNGVSTSETITDISGRGVGMNAVEAVVKEAGGELQVDSVPGKGAQFVITVPRKSMTSIAMPNAA